MKARLPQGYGKQSMAQLMQQAQQMQENVKKKQEELEQTLYSVTAGGGMVELTMTGNHQVTSLKLNPDVVQPDDIEMLEDLIAAAVNEAAVSYTHLDVYKRQDPGDAREPILLHGQ